MKKQVVVTGLGLVTPLGINTKNVWGKLLKGKSGIVSLPLEVFKSNSRVGGMISERDKDIIYNKNDKQLTQFMQYAMYATQEALKDAGWQPKTEKELERTGICIGSGIGSLDEIMDATRTFDKYGSRKISPFFVPRYLMNLAGNHRK
jgi:3-oxoacyl-[acyl-carrier-protein] synthase II